MLLFTLSLLLLLACLALGKRQDSSYLDGLSENQRRLFDYSMEALDAYYAPPFLFRSPRYSAWYAVGLLARNEGNDVGVASGIIRNVIKYQYDDPTKIWFGTVRTNPDAPDPGDVYAPRIYTSYDPNMGLFVCTSWIIVMEEFQHLLSPDLVDLMKRSMYNATVGDGYRVGGVHGDNLRPVYSNPWLMRVMASTYVGHMMGDDNMTHWGEVWAEEATVEFDRFGTLSEYNSGTYTGVSLYALSLWGYMPENSTIFGRAKDMIAKTWDDLGHFYNPTLSSLGGPWDRAYGYDMKRYVGILGGQLAGLVGGIDDGAAALPIPLVGSDHVGDAAILPLLPLVSKFHDPYVSSNVLTMLTTLDEGTSHHAQAVSPPFDSVDVPRNYTMWKQPGLSAGGMEIDGDVVGGAAVNPGQFVPANIIWDTGVEGTGVSWINLHATSSSISAIATSSNITIRYPPSKAFGANETIPSDTMSLLFFGIYGVAFPLDFLSNGSAELPGLKLTLSGNMMRGERSFVYGQSTLNEMRYYSLTYVAPEDLGEEVPELVLGFEKV